MTSRVAAQRFVPKHVPASPRRVPSLVALAVVAGVAWYQIFGQNAPLVDGATVGPATTIVEDAQRNADQTVIRAKAEAREAALATSRQATAELERLIADLESRKTELSEQVRQRRTELEQTNEQLAAARSMAARELEQIRAEQDQLIADARLRSQEMIRRAEAEAEAHAAAKRKAVDEEVRRLREVLGNQTTSILSALSNLDTSIADGNQVIDLASETETETNRDEAELVGGGSSSGYPLIDTAYDSI